MMTRGPWVVGPGVFVGARLSLPRELYILFKKKKKNAEIKNKTAGEPKSFQQHCKT